jgi:hypothetical protein
VLLPTLHLVQSKPDHGHRTCLILSVITQNQSITIWKIIQEFN